MTRRNLPHLTLLSMTTLLGVACGAHDASDVGSDVQGSTPGSPIVGLDGKCLDVSASSGKIQLYGCDGTVGQEWSYSGGRLVGQGGKCLDIHWDEQQAGTVVDLFECNGTQAQKWAIKGKTIVSTAGLCLDVKGNVSANGTQIQVWDCNGQANQEWSSSAFPSEGGSGSGSSKGSGSGSGSSKGSGSSSSSAADTDYDVFPTGHGVFPAGGTSPLYPTSVFHKKLPANPVTLPDSISQKWNQYNEDGHGTWGAFGGSTQPQYDEGWPVYFVNGRPGIVDASYYNVDCDLTSWAANGCKTHGFMSGSLAPFPVGYTLEENSDHHVTTIDMKTRTEYDFWYMETLAGPGVVGHVGGGGACSIDGDGYNCSNANATNMPNSIGMVYYADLLYCETSDDDTCVLPTALAIAPKCNSSGANAGFKNNYTYPAAYSDSQCFAKSSPPSDGVVEGDRAFLDLTDAQINALPLAKFEKIFLRTIDREHYGVIVRDTGWSGGAAFQINAESNSPYALYGNESPMVAVAKLEGLSPDSHGVYTFQVSDPSGINVLQNLKWCAPSSAGETSGLCDGT
jgi:hypothetical protein